MGVAGQVVQDSFGTGEAPPTVHHPLLSAEPAEEATETIEIASRAPLRDAILLSLADLTPDPGLELVFLGSGSVRALVQKEGSYAEVRSLGEVKLAFAHPDGAGLRVWPYVFAPAEGERDALLVPVPDGYAVVRFGDAGVARTDPGLARTVTPPAMPSVVFVERSRNSRRSIFVIG